MGRKLDIHSRILINYIKKNEGVSFDEILEFVARDQHFHDIVKSICNNTYPLSVSDYYNCLKTLRDWVNRRLSSLEKQGYLLAIIGSNKSRKFFIWPLYLESSLKESFDELKADFHFVLDNFKENFNKLDSNFSYFLIRPIGKLLETIYEWGYNRGLDTFELGMIIRNVSNRYGGKTIKRIYGPLISFIYENIIKKTKDFYRIFDITRVDPSSPFPKAIKEFEVRKDEFIKYLKSRIKGDRFNWDTSDIEVIKEFLDSITKPYLVSRLTRVRISRDCNKYNISYRINICLSETHIKYLDGRMKNQLLITPKKVNKSYINKLVKRVREFVRYVFRDDENQVRIIVSKKIPIITEKEFVSILTKIVSKSKRINQRSKIRKQPLIIKIISPKEKAKNKLKRLEDDKIIKLAPMDARNTSIKQLNIDKDDSLPNIVLIENIEYLPLFKQNILVEKLLRLISQENLSISVIILEIKDPLKISYTYRKADMIYILL